MALSTAHTPKPSKLIPITKTLHIHYTIKDGKSQAIFKESCKLTVKN